MQATRSAAAGDIACDPDLFYSENRLHDDGCFIQDRERQSAGIGTYLTASLIPQTNCGEAVSKMASCHNLHYKNGFGMTSACAIDADSSARMGAQQTNPRHRQQLTSRVYHGHPHFERGILEPTLESELIHTEGTRTSRACGVLSGMGIDRFDPLLPCIDAVMQNADTVINERQGSNTRAWVRQHQHGAFAQQSCASCSPEGLRPCTRK